MKPTHGNSNQSLERNSSNRKVTTKRQYQARLNNETLNALVERVKDLNKEIAADKSLGKGFCNLVEEARAGKLDPVIGRDEEIRRVLQILSRRTKNNASVSA